MKNIHRDPKLMASCADEFFAYHQKSGKPFTVNEFCDYTGYALITFRNYRRDKEKYAEYVHSNGDGTFSVKGYVPPPDPFLVDRYYTLVGGSAEMWFMVIALVIAGLWWK